MANRRPKVVVTDYDHFSLELERKVLNEINPEFVVAHLKQEIGNLKPKLKSELLTTN